MSDELNTAPSDHAIFLERGKAALDKNDLLEWCRIMAADVGRSLSDVDKTAHLGNGRLEKMLADEAAELAAIKK